MAERTMEIMSGLVLEDGRRWGEVAEGFQIDDARAVLVPDDGDPLQHWLSRSKGTSKTTDVSGFGCAWLVDQAEPLAEAYVAAADLEQADRLLNRARGLIARTPALSGVLEVQRGRIVNVRNGAYLQALAADQSGAEGILSPLILIDELPANWPNTVAARGLATALLSAVPKVPGCRLVVIGHAGSPGSWSHRLFELVRKDPAWRVSHREGPPPWIPESALEQQRRLLLPSQYERRWENRWRESEDRLSSHADVVACAVLDGPQAPEPGRWYATGVDLAVTGDRAAVATCHLESVGRGYVDGQRLEDFSLVVVDRLRVWKGSRRAPIQLQEIEDYVRATAQLYPGRTFLDPYQGVSMLQRLQANGVSIESVAFTQQSNTRLATVLFGLLRDRRLRLPNEPLVVEELSNVKIVEKGPGLYRIDHDASGHDDIAVAVGLASVKLLERPVRKGSGVTRYSRSGWLAGTR